MCAPVVASSGGAWQRAAFGDPFLPLGGGRYRLIVAFDFARRIAFIKFLGTHAEYDELLASLVATKCVPDGSKIWWDARPHHA